MNNNIIMFVHIVDKSLARRILKGFEVWLAVDIRLCILWTTVDMSGWIEML